MPLVVETFGIVLLGVEWVMGWMDVSDKLEELPIGRYAHLLGMRSRLQSLDQLGLTFRELWKISW